MEAAASKGVAAAKSHGDKSQATARPNTEVAKVSPSTEDRAGAEDDAAYEQRKLAAALKVAQEDLAAEKAKASADFLSPYFQLAHDRSGLQLASRVPSLCRDDKSASVMHVTVSSRSCKDEGGRETCGRSPLFASLQAVCPRFDENVSLSIPDDVLRAAALVGHSHFCASVRVERFNLALDDVMRSEFGAPPHLGCRRLTMASGLGQPPLPPDCARLRMPLRTAPSELRQQNMNGSERLATACSLLRGMTGHGETASERAAALLLAHRCAPPAWRAWRAERSPPNAHEKELGRFTGPRWLRIIGDSVAWNLVGRIKSVFLQLHGRSGGLVETHRTSSGGGPPKSVVWRSDNAQTQQNYSVWVSYESFFDGGEGPEIYFPTGLQTKDAELSSKLLAAGASGTAVYLSFGSHSQRHVGGDAAAERRYHRALLRLLATLPPHSKLVLALQSAWGLGVPTRFSGTDTCYQTNLRVEAQGRAQSRALHAACGSDGDGEEARSLSSWLSSALRGASSGVKARGVRCRELDLFSATLPHIFDPTIFRPGDPVHFKLARPMASYIDASIAAAFAS